MQYFNYYLKHTNCNYKYSFYIKLYKYAQKNEYTKNYTITKHSIELHNNVQ